MIQPITPCLWFDNQAEEAVQFYTSIFNDSKIEGITRYTKEGFEYHGQIEGSVLTVSFQINGQQFIAMNGGKAHTINEAISFQVLCDTQDEIDNYWEKLTNDGQEVACGWLKDKYGVSWQIVPTILLKWLMDPRLTEPVTKAYLQMVKVDIRKLEEAAKI